MMKLRFAAPACACVMLVFFLGCGNKGDDAGKDPVKISGVIVYEDGSPVADTQVNVDGPTILVVNTDGMGKFNTDSEGGLIPGEYRFYIVDMMPMGDAVMPLFEATITVKEANSNLKVTLKKPGK